MLKSKQEEGVDLPPAMSRLCLKSRLVAMVRSVEGIVGRCRRAGAPPVRKNKCWLFEQIVFDQWCVLWRWCLGGWRHDGGIR